MPDLFIPLVKKGTQPTTPPNPVTGGTRIVIDPVTRLEGHLKVEVQSEGGVVTSARSSGMMFRGFENLLQGKDPRDAAHVTQRICGVCPIAHGMSACLAMEAAAGLTVPENARLVRNLIHGADFLHSHILHFYHLALPTYIQPPAAAPWAPAYSADIRVGAADNQAFLDHYMQALAMRRLAHEVGAILGGKMPHTVAFEYGGVTARPTAQTIGAVAQHLATLVAFIDGVLLPDADRLAGIYPDYFGIGRGYGNLLAFGVFDLNADGSQKLLRRGLLLDGDSQPRPLDLSAIEEHTASSWYSDSVTSRNPADGMTQPDPDRTGGYSWLKAPRYNGVACEVGSLARMRVNGSYGGTGISVMDRHLAQAHEASLIAHAMQDWLAAINPTAAFFTPAAVPASGVGVGLTEAARGALGHWLRLAGSVVAGYQILTPTCWNCSPRDAAGVPGPLEKALEGTPAADAAQPVEVLRVVHSFDPCLSCAVH